MAGRLSTFIPLALLLSAGPVAAQQDSAQFFEMRIRPLFQEKCVACHSDEKRMSGLSLEGKTGAEAGGNRGPIAVAGKPEESRIIEAVSYTGALKMPPTGRLREQQREDLQARGRGGG